MREELKKIKELGGHYSLGDFRYFFDLCKKLDDGRMDRIMRIQDEVEKENPDQVFDIMDDIHWYSYLESFVIWHFALVRMQGVLEAFIGNKILKTNPTHGGISTRLTELKRAGFTISAADEAELKEWAGIRNAITHSPPSSYTQGILEESDIKEYYDLCLKVAGDLEKQLAANTKE